MSKRKYYYLVASLPDFMLERNVKNFDFKALFKEVCEPVLEKDRVFVSELFHFQERAENSEEKLELSHEDWTHFYQEIGENSNNKFVRSWLEFDQLLRNIQTAWICRKTGADASKQLIGRSEEIEPFLRNNMSDFGLRRELVFGEQIFNLLDEDIDLLEREFRLDQIRWDMADELTTFNYFDLDNVLAFLVKAEILDRWLKLDEERGALLFNGFVKSLVEQKKVNI